MHLHCSIYLSIYLSSLFIYSSIHPSTHQSINLCKVSLFFVIPCPYIFRSCFSSLELFYVSDTSQKKKAGEHCEDLSFKTTVMFSALPISSSLSPQGNHSICSLTLSSPFPLKCFRNISYSLTIHSQAAACYIRSFINMSHRFYS